MASGGRGGGREGRGARGRQKLLGQEQNSQLTLGLMTPPVHAASNVTSQIAVLPLGGYAGYSFFCIICCLPVVDVTRVRV